MNTKSHLATGLCALAIATVSFLSASCGSTRVDTRSGAVVESTGAVALESKRPLVGEAATLHINGLSCPQCATNVDEQLARIRGVRSVVVDLGTGTARLELAGGDSNPTPARLTHAVADAGFTLVKITQGN